MSKPFKITSPQPTGWRDPNSGKFTRVVPPAPPQIVREASQRGVPVNQVIEENRAPEHPTPAGKPSGQEIPWPEAGPVNDADKKPMKLAQ